MIESPRPLAFKDLEYVYSSIKQKRIDCEESITPPSKEILNNLHSLEMKLQGMVHNVLNIDDKSKRELTNPPICELFGFMIEVIFIDGMPPHINASNGKSGAKFMIEDAQYFNKTYDMKQKYIRLIQAWIHEYESELMMAWLNLGAGESYEALSIEPSIDGRYL
jgi:hypothetical protein